MFKNLDCKNYETINGGGILGAIAGGVIGFDAGLIGGLAVNQFTGDDSDVLSTAWAGAGAGFYYGAVAPTP